jgi:hypothetical protein
MELVLFSCTPVQVLIRTVLGKTTRHHYTCPWCILGFVWCLDYHRTGSTSQPRSLERDHDVLVPAVSHHCQNWND